MIEPIGESAVRMTTRSDTTMAVDNKDVALEKIEKSVEERPIESVQESTTAESESDTEEEKTSGYNTDDNGIYFEKYDKKGNVIFRVPPEQKPIDEHA